MDLIGEITTDFWILAKVAILVFLGIYIIFSMVIVKQAKLMAATLDVEFDNVIVIVSYIHLLFAVGVFVVSLLLL